MTAVGCWTHSKQKGKVRVIQVLVDLVNQRGAGLDLVLRILDQVLRYIRGVGVRLTARCQRRQCSVRVLRDGLSRKIIFNCAGHTIFRNVGSKFSPWTRLTVFLSISSSLYPSSILFIGRVVRKDS